MEQSRVKIRISGIVQGVGFRPFVHSLAKRLALTGWVRNTSAGVDIEAEGKWESLQNFLNSLRTETPPLARIDSLDYDWLPPQGFPSFTILPSQDIADAFQPISPDMSICPDCLRELYDPQDRRYRYPFINCTNCGPRFTIIKDIPYDRPLTTMATFPMCPDCAREYHDPANRRFHAQPIACPSCGPRIWLESSSGKVLDIAQTSVDGPIPQPKQRYLYESDQVISEARRLLAEGKILAIKGLGGFHLACDATSPQAVRELRRRKLRVDKPFALMMPDLETIAEHCVLTQTAQTLLESRQRPIVILERQASSTIVEEVAPAQHTLGIMLPYTPLHYLLIEKETSFPPALVMTSGNLSEEPIASDNQAARQQLASLADAFLMHDRDIYIRCDDSVVREFCQKVYPLRRSRGYAPMPVYLHGEVPSVLAVGAELKNTFCLTKGRYGFLSHHIGDLQNYETFQSFEDSILHFENLFRVNIEAIGYDLHPDYLATRYALERAQAQNLPAFGVQHHHAHITACMAEHGIPLQETFIGVAFDGTGYGNDGAIWGGEFLVASYTNFQRLYHLAYIPLPGGDLAVREPWRLALAWLEQVGIGWEADLPPYQFASEQKLESTSGQSNLSLLHRQLKERLNTPLTSSMGRLFDAIASLVNIRQKVNYEAQAAIELEALASNSQLSSADLDVYPFEISGEVVDPAPLIRAIINDLRHNLPAPIISAKFHHSVARMVLEVCRLIRDKTSLRKVALSGGVWQNMTLLTETVKLLSDDDFEVLTHTIVPANDGGIALGQATVVIACLKQ